MKKNFTSLVFSLLLVSQLFSQGDTLYLDMVHDDSLRSYILYVPADYDGTEDWPLVINYHGYTNTATNQMDISQMNLVADTAHFLVAYPQGLSINNPAFGSAGLGWNINGTLSDNDDFDFTSRLIDHIDAAYPIDRARVHATGWSLGAIMSFTLSCEMPDEIASIGGVSGRLADFQMPDCDPGRPYSTLLIYGTEDPIDAYEGDGLFFSAVPNTPAFYADLNNCSPDSVVTELPDVTTADSSTVTLIEYENCDAGAEVLFYRVNGGGHQWPGGTDVFPQFNLGHLNLDIHASSEIWNFFQRNTHPNPPGQVLERNFVHEDSLRSYLLYVPSAYDGTEDWPLVLNIHGYALDAGFQMEFSQMNAVADTGHFLIAYPQGTPIVSSVPNVPPTGLGFNISGPGDTMFVSPRNVDDVDFMRQIIDHVGADYRVAPERVYSTGFSNGGIMSFVLACELPDRIAAIASVGGTIPTSRVCDAAEADPKPVFLIHGTEDVQVPYADGGPFLDGPRQILDFWASVNGCAVTPDSTALPDLTMADSTTIDAFAWTDCTAEVLHYRVNGGGHQWPGGNNLLPFLGHFNLDINASSEIWKFFNRSILVSVKPEPIPARVDFSVYPNPFSDELMVEFELPREQAVQLRLLNALGQVVGEKTYRSLPGGLHRLPWQVPAEWLPAGLYYLQWTIEERKPGMEPVFYTPH